MMTPIFDRLTPEQRRERGQIQPDSDCGRRLTELAAQSEYLVELGTWRGLGSTYCLALGLQRPSQRLFTVELMRKFHDEARSYYDDDRITFLWGTLVQPDEVPPNPRPDPEWQGYYEYEVEKCRNAPYVLPQLPAQIDLLLVDAGHWSAEVELSKLQGRSRIIALDDTHPTREVKNHRNLIRLIEAGWQVIAQEPEQRNGWAILRQP